MNSFDGDVSDAILEASRIQARENLDLDGLFGEPHWAPELFTGSASRSGLIQPRFETVIATKDGPPLLVCSRLTRNDDGHERDGVTLEDIIGQQDGLTKGAIEACVRTGGYSVGGLCIVPLEVYDVWGYNMGQLSALVEADPEAKEELANLLTENSKRTASQQVEITLFNNDGIVEAGPSLHDSLSAGINTKDENKERIPNLPRSMAHDGSKTITNKMIHAATIDTKGVGLWIPKSSRGNKPKPNGHWLIRFTGVTTTHREATRKGISKRKHSEPDSDSD